MESHCQILLKEIEIIFSISSDTARKTITQTECTSQFQQINGEVNKNDKRVGKNTKKKNLPSVFNSYIQDMKLTVQQFLGEFIELAFQTLKKSVIIMISNSSLR